MTIHKVQGLTAEKITVDISEAKEKIAGLTYVALSRVRRFQDLYIMPFGFDRLKIYAISRVS